MGRNLISRWEGSEWSVADPGVLEVEAEGALNTEQVNTAPQ